MSIPQPIANQQTVGNIGLFYVCYRLSRMGWNVMPTARNAKGIDILIYSQDAARTKTIQVKTLSKGSPVPLGNKLDHLFADFVVVCRHVIREIPECFILTPGEVRNLAHCGEKDGKISYWLQPRGYAKDEFREKWERIGAGLSTEPIANQPLIQAGMAEARFQIGQSVSFEMGKRAVRGIVKEDRGQIGVNGRRLYAVEYPSGSETSNRSLVELTASELKSLSNDVGA